MLFLIVTFVVLATTSALELEKRADHKCYSHFGCFQKMAGVFPQSPAEVGTEFLLYTRQNKGSPTTIMGNASQSSWTHSVSSHFKNNRPTKFIIHGFSNTKTQAWMINIKNALLTKGDYNVFIVGWGNGAQFPYEQATSNVFLVAEQTKLFIQNLHSAYHINLNDVHLMGHSLGAHLCGVIGHHVRGIGRISAVTSAAVTSASVTSAAVTSGYPDGHNVPAMDPAEPSFTTLDKSFRLDSSDAHFVDVIHSDGATFAGIRGYGWIVPQGHVDFYPNGGKDQPGCSDNPLGSAINNILHGTDIHKIAGAVSCSHGRSHDYFLESITSSCQFKAHKCHSWSDYEAGKCSGCSGGCPQMGFNVDQSTRGSFYLSTTQKAPYCGTEYYIELTVQPEGDEDANGRFYITFNGQHGSTGEVEFSRSDRFFTKSKKTETHIIAVHKDVGTISSIKLKFNKGSGLSGLLAPDHIKVHSVTVRKLTDNHTTKFCDNGKTLFTSKQVKTLSHKTGC